MSPTLLKLERWNEYMERSERGKKKLIIDKNINKHQLCQSVLPCTYSIAVVKLKVLLCPEISSDLKTKEISKTTRMKERGKAKSDLIT